MPIIDWNCQQGTPAWYKARAGIPTASRFADIMTPKQRKPSEKRKKYACQLIAQRLMNWQPDSLEHVEHIANGKANEPIAVAKMEMVFEVETKPVGFIRTNDGRFGASPDRVSEAAKGIDRVIEVKCPTVPVHMGRLLFGDDDDYICQRQGQLWVAEADKAIFFSFNPMMPDYMVEDGRDEKFIADLKDCLERFSDELEAWTEQVKRCGEFMAYPDLVPPIDAARGKALRTEPVDSEEELQRLLDIQHYKWGG